MFGKVGPSGDVRRNAEEDYSLDKMNLDRKDEEETEDFYAKLNNKNVRLKRLIYRNKLTFN